MTTGVRSAAQILDDVLAHDAGRAGYALRDLAAEWEAQCAADRRSERARRAAAVQAVRAEIVKEMDALVYRCAACSQWRIQAAVARVPHECNRCPAIDRSGFRCVLRRDHDETEHRLQLVRRSDRPTTPVRRRFVPAA